MRLISVTCITILLFALPFPVRAAVGDVTNDGRVTISDYLAVIASFGGSDTSRDLNQNGNIDIFDLLVVIMHFGESDGSPTITPTPPPSSTIGIRIDTTDTDNYVNNFILTIARNGNPKVAASGSWWGPVEKFFENQIWIVNRTMYANRTSISPGSTFSQQFTCLLPGKSGGTQRNTLTTPFLRMQIGPNANVRRDGPMGQFQSLQLTAENGGTQEIRTTCVAFEDIANAFGDGSPRQGDRIQVNLDQQVWFGPLGTPGAKEANHDGIPVRYDIVDTHIWYEGIEYAYGHLDGATVPGRGDVSPYQLIGSTVNGTITLYGFAYKTGNTGQAPLHHLELRAEQDGEDYAVVRHLSPPAGSPLGFGKSQRHAMQFDTTKLTDGWHILSWHFHVIDKRTGIFNNKQFAGELKFPVCVNNHGTGNCP